MIDALTHQLTARIGANVLGEALRQADKAWLDALITRREPVEQWTQSLQRQPDDIKVIVEFS